jgi:hypothetical protein
MELELKGFLGEYVDRQQSLSSYHLPAHFAKQQQ